MTLHQVTQNFLQTFLLELIIMLYPSSSANTLPMRSNSGDSDPSQNMESLRSTNAWGILYSISPKLYDNIHLESNDEFTAV